MPLDQTEQWVPHRRETWPWRYGRLKIPVEMSCYKGFWSDNQPAMTKKQVPAGTMVKIVMVSRMGDVGITDDLSAETGYGCRVALDDLDRVNDSKVPKSRLVITGIE